LTQGGTIGTLVSSEGPKRVGQRAAMPTVKLKLTRWLCQNLNIAPAGAGDICVSVPEGESILGVVRCVAAEKGVFWHTILEEIGASVVVVLNGSLINPHDRPEAVLKEGDEVLFLPMFDGG
jgi:molybdopterin converting factor small subunit